MGVVQVRWRLVLVAVQLALLGLGAYFSEGLLAADGVLFAALLGIALNPLLAEWPFSPPGDTVVAGVFGLVALSVMQRERLPMGTWVFALAFLALLVVLSVIALWFGANRQEEHALPTRVARAAWQIVKNSDSRVVLSPVFALSLIETVRGVDARLFWALGTWSALVLVGSVDWQQVVATARIPASGGIAEGMVSPSRLQVSVRGRGAAIPPVGEGVTVSGGSVSAEGTVVARIPRRDDAWAEVYFGNSKQAESLLRAGRVTIVGGAASPAFIGSVDVGSTPSAVVFTATRPIEMSSAVRVIAGTGSTTTEVIYQVAAMEVGHASVAKGQQLTIRVVGRQVGVFDTTTGEIRAYTGSPVPGAPVLAGPGTVAAVAAKPGQMLLGQLLGTTIPVFLDLARATAGHMAVIGMTRTGKSTFARRLANAYSTFAGGRRVVAMDPTGEWVKSITSRYSGVADWLTPGLCVDEPPLGTGAKTPPAFALGRLEDVMGEARKEYNADPATVRPRTVLLDEAHIFVPEPTALPNGFDRDASLRFSSQLMMVRKYGISAIFVTPRTAVIGKGALTQCETVVAFRTIDQTGLDYVAMVAGLGVGTVLPTLAIGQALVSGAAISCENAVAIEVAR